MCPMYSVCFLCAHTGPLPLVGAFDFTVFYVSFYRFRLLYASVTVLGSRKSPIVCSLPRISLHRPCTRESPKDWTIFSYSVFQLKYASFSMPVYVLPWPYRTRHTAKSTSYSRGRDVCTGLSTGFQCAWLSLRSGIVRRRASSQPFEKPLLVNHHAGVFWTTWFPNWRDVKCLEIVWDCFGSEILGWTDVKCEW